MDTKFTRKELCSAVNAALKDDSISTGSLVNDSRMKSELTIRMIRDYGYKKFISPTIRDGKHVYYTQTHLDELLVLRKLKASGISDKLLQNMNIEYSSPKVSDDLEVFGSSVAASNSLSFSGSVGQLDTNFDNELFDTIDSIKNRNEPKIPQLSKSSAYNSDKLVKDNLNELLRSSVTAKQIQPEKQSMDEYNINSDITLKIKSTTQIEDLNDLELIIKNILINYTKGVKK